MVPINTLAVGEGRDEASPRGAWPSSGSGVQRIPGGAQDQGDGRTDFHATRLDPAEIGKFSIVYADPPWKYQTEEGQFTVKKKGVRTVPHSAATKHYQTVGTAAIKGFPVADILEDDALLFLWTTGGHIPDALTVGPAWGFKKYITMGFVWDKQRTTAGRYTLAQTEFVLIFKRGRIPQPRGARNIRQFLSEKRTVHSKKPDEIRDRISQMFPEQRKIELFARGKPAPGWVAWGEEVQP